MPAEHPHLVPVGAQPFGDEPAERSGAAGHQDRGHAAPSLRTSASPLEAGTVHGVPSTSFAAFTGARTPVAGRGPAAEPTVGTDLLTRVV
ncbi:hypothetical protein GCM10023336_13610 [Streptomyces similanensis]|uniref:Uncharacterized protein n=1 Tax=Streptomyces similanensis TaxID=1274988 RepID=A0ABP9JZB4_9ACTN